MAQSTPPQETPNVTQKVPSFIQRAAEPKLHQLAQGFPIVSLTGPRQSGKTTLVRAAFPDYDYVNLEQSATRQIAQDDPETFFHRYPSRLIIDEAQVAPGLFNDLQVVSDEANEPGRYILTGSQNFLLLNSISQSLAGRVGLLRLPPLSYQELCAAGLRPATVWKWIWKGGYPRLFEQPIEPSDYFSAYLETYIDRDIRSELGTGSISTFNRFVQLCATRIGEVLNLANLARDSGIDPRTADRWLSLLEASYIIFKLPPYSNNFGKQLTKSLKLYFYDTGLACHLLGIESPTDVIDNPLRGSLFENAVITEIAKQYLAQGRIPPLSYWRDNHQQEIDLIVERGISIRSIVEIKSSATFNTRFFTTVSRLGDLMKVPLDRRFVAYAGADSFMTRRGHLVGLDHLSEVTGLTQSQ
jgi:predicted AAA+ superfamily ATPase